MVEMLIVDIIHYTIRPLLQVNSVTKIAWEDEVNGRLSTLFRNASFTRAQGNVRFFTDFLSSSAFSLVDVSDNSYFICCYHVVNDKNDFWNALMCNPFQTVFLEILSIHKRNDGLFQDADGTFLSTLTVVIIMLKISNLWNFMTRFGITIRNAFK